jgi:glycosyltransferase involved in cell wall biosynthesis
MIADDHTNFANAVIMLLSDKNKNESMAREAKTFAMANFTWERHLKTLSEIYRNS